MKKKIPSFKSDAAAERFVSRADLTRYDLSGLKPVRFEFEKKAAQLNDAAAEAIIGCGKAGRAKERGIPYTRFLRELIEQGISMPLAMKHRMGVEGINRLGLCHCKIPKIQVFKALSQGNSANRGTVREA